jgi:hypothetical protein
MKRPLLINDFATAVPPEFPYIKVKFDFLFYLRRLIYEEGLPNIWGNAQIFNHIQYEEAVTKIWLCNRSLLNFLVQYMRKIFFFFISVDWALFSTPPCQGHPLWGKNIEIWRVRKLQIRVRGKVVCALSRSLTRPLHQTPPRPTTEKPQAKGLARIGVWPQLTWRRWIGFMHAIPPGRGCSAASCW